jgi:SAM-dependent methyltransferase/MoaA/NifB/PqqE/SkfB family radical SAM enzyme
MCPVTSNSFLESNTFKFIDLNFLRNIVDELDHWPSIKAIWYLHFGEPLAHPDYRECLEILYQSSVARQAMVIQSTNASLLQGEKAEAILDVPIIKKLVFSFDGFGDQASFERLRGPHYDQVLRNIREFSEQAKQLRPDLLLATCTILPREEEVPGLRIPETAEALDHLHRLFDPLGVHVEIRNMHDYSSNDQLELRGIKPERIFGGCIFVEQDSLYFTVNGWAQPCCAVYQETFNGGGFPEQGFGDLLNSKFMRNLRNRLRLDQRTDLPYCRNCSLSVGGNFNPIEFDSFWKERDHQGLLQDLAERRHICGELISGKHPVIRVDLGCGTRKPEGFIGVDRYALTGVDIVADLNQSLPFHDNSVDLVLSSHGLEHVNSLQETMKEIYRICRHGAQVCIIAPYGQQSLNLANPFHKQVFNEHTPRFWTDSPTVQLDPAEYKHPHAGNWGLAESDNSPAEMDLRCFRMEFFYFPEYRHLSQEEQRSARKKYLNVCDQIMYHLVVIKEPISEGDMEDMTKRMDYYEPPGITIRRFQERSEFLEQELKQAHSILASHETELTDTRKRLAEKDARIDDELSRSKSLEADVAQLKDRIIRQEKDLEHFQSTLGGYQAEIEQTKSALTTRDAELQETRRILTERETELCLFLSKGKAISSELDLFRHRKVTRLMNRFLNKSDLQNDLLPTFLQLKDDSFIFTKNLKGYRLLPSKNLQWIPFVHYPLELNRKNLKGILLAPIMDFPSRNGMLGIEILSPDGRIVAHSVVPASQINETLPTRFDFPPIPNSDRGRFWLRVFVHHVDFPVRIFEWKKYGFLRFGSPQTRAFCGFLFENVA